MTEEASVKPEEKKQAEQSPKPVEGGIKKEEPKKEEKKERIVVQKPDNCMKCNKRLQRKTCYYRNEGYYCSKRCWKLAEAEKAEAAKK